MVRRKLSQHEWLERRLKQLINLSTKILAVDRAEYGEPKYGFWSLKKEIALMYCIWPFLQIAKEHFDFNYYLDLFAGSGMMKVDENMFFVGSPMVALGGTPPNVKFDGYLCFENQRSRANALDRRLMIVSDELKTGPCRVFSQDCNQQLPLILKSIDDSQPDKVCFLAFVDPEGLEIDWSTVETLLKSSRGDMILTFSTSGILRNIGEAKDHDALGETFTRFFGSEDWRNLEVNGDSLVQFYKSRLANVDGKARTTYNIPVKDESNHRLYDIVFATGSAGMGNVISDLNERLDRIRTRDFRSLCSALVGESTQLNDFLQG
ncbi:three-Cys-motif partner protein TcmP [Candidatus Bathyarchaeota archaeon]|nr:three-Cys-motif partner protein TcmP [Candidatus Bathyarchaeota archaeon]